MQFEFLLNLYNIIKILLLLGFRIYILIMLKSAINRIVKGNFKKSLQMGNYFKTS